MPHDAAGYCLPLACWSRQTCDTRHTPTSVPDARDVKNRRLPRPPAPPPAALAFVRDSPNLVAAVVRYQEASIGQLENRHGAAPHLALVLAKHPAGHEVLRL